MLNCTSLSSRSHSSVVNIIIGADNPKFRGMQTQLCFFYFLSLKLPCEAECYVIFALQYILDTVMYIMVLSLFLLSLCDTLVCCFSRFP